jgi:hypothetical protein
MLFFVALCAPRWTYSDEIDRPHGVQGVQLPERGHFQVYLLRQWTILEPKKRLPERGGRQMASYKVAEGTGWSIASARFAAAV